MRTIGAAIFALLIAAPAYAGPLQAPDDTLTPGATRTGAAHAPRPALSAAVVKEVAKRYGVELSKTDKQGVHDHSCGTGRCEIDHRIPWGCNGASVPNNLSYQTAAAYPKKDRLEHWAERQVTLRRLTVEECQQMFEAPNQWQARYRVVFREDP